MTQHTKGIVYALSAAFILGLMGVVAKLLGNHLSPLDIIFYRNIVAVILVLISLFFIKKLYLLKTKRPYAHLTRTIIGTITNVLIVWSFILMPIATATSLHFTAPLFVSLLSYPLLKEKVGRFRITFILIGFLGVIVIAQPESNISNFHLMIGLTAGFMNALVAICLRWLGDTEDSFTTTFYFLFFGLLLTSLFMPFIGTLPEVDILHLIFAMGIVGVSSLFLKTQSFRLAPAALISPISYTILIWAIIFDWLIWDTVPTTNLILGASIIIGSNILILWREKAKKDKN
jgi:drug/metabolite transporter (DMT)-like permease